jgi:ankyrin repeat protein
MNSPSKIRKGALIVSLLSASTAVVTLGIATSPRKVVAIPAKKSPLSRLDAALIQAVRKGNLTEVQRMLAQGANPNISNDAGSPVLNIACNVGSLPIVTALLDKGANLNAWQTGKDGNPPLITAAFTQNAPLVKLLLAHGANVNAVVDKGFYTGSTALMIVAGSGQVGLSKLLLDAGADIRAEANDGSNALVQAASNGSTGVMKLLLEKGADVNSRNWVGTTALMHAVTSGNLESVKFLIAKGANVNARDDAYRRTYLQAAFVGDKETMKQMQTSGALKALHENGASALSTARSFKQQAMIDVLVAAGAKE